jgi:hypothetical protein
LGHALNQHRRGSRIKMFTVYGVGTEGYSILLDLLHHLPTPKDGRNGCTAESNVTCLKDFPLTKCALEADNAISIFVIKWCGLASWQQEEPLIVVLTRCIPQPRLKKRNLPHMGPL